MTQFPEWAELPIERVPPPGTDNALYRLGDELVARLPRIEGPPGASKRTSSGCRRLAPLLPAEIPVPLARGAPGAGFPWEWGVYGWIEGENPGLGSGTPGLARDLAPFVRAIQRVEFADPPASRRGAPLAAQDGWLARRSGPAGGAIDVAAAARRGRRAGCARLVRAAPVWLHADLLPGNMFVRDGPTRRA